MRWNNVITAHVFDVHIHIIYNNLRRVEHPGTVISATELI